MYHPERQPLSIDVHDDDALRAWLARQVQDEVMARGHPLAAIRLLKDGYQEIIDWARLVEGEPEADLAATWAMLLRLPMVERWILVVGLESEEGKFTAWILEQQVEDGVAVGWWFAYRPYTQNQNIGLLLGDAWEQFVGEGPLPEPFAGLLQAGPGTRPARLGPAQKKEPRMWMQSGELSASLPLPTTAMAMGEMVQGVVLRALKDEGMKHLLVFVLRGRSWEKWLIAEPMPTDAGDMVRWVCGQKVQPESVGTAEAVLLRIKGQMQRAIRIVSERDGHRAERVLVLVPKEGTPGDFVPGQGYARELGAVPEGEGWIGVAPNLAGELIATALRTVERPED